MSIISGANAVTGAGAVSYQIERSLRFNSADSAYLSRTPASAGNRKTWTWSGWVKRAQLGAVQGIFDAYSSGLAFSSLFFASGDKLYFYTCTNSGSFIDYDFVTTAYFKDPSAWYHFVITFDTGNATEADRFIVYVNGVRQTGTTPSGAIPLNYEGYINSTQSHNIGVRADGSYYSNQYMAEVNFIDGSALDPTSFGEYNTDTGVWQPKAYTGSYGTNGFYLDFADNSSTTALGYDAAGSNDWTPNNFSVTAGAGNDSLVDTPTPYGTDTGVGGEVRGNYATLNPLDSGYVTLSNGNLDAVLNTSVSPQRVETNGSIAVSSGKWYWETTYTGGSSELCMGVVPFYSTNSIFGLGVGYFALNGTKYVDGANSGYGATYTTGDIIGVALDIDGGTITFYKNNTSQGAITLPTGVSAWKPNFGNGTRSNTQSITANFGQRPFAYTAPSGFKALCTQNLPEPTVVDGGEYFNTVLYPGNNQTLQSITTVGFQPDLIWIKNRNASNHVLVDSVRGRGFHLASNLTNAEATDSSTQGVTAFLSNGFSVEADPAGYGSVNDGTNPYVAWNWKANGAGVSNTDGTITSTVSANTTAGFSIVTYTGQASVGTVGHGLGFAPAMIIVKNRNQTYNWSVYHKNLTSAAYVLLLNTTGAELLSSAQFNSTAPTSSVFTVGTGGNTNSSGDTFVAYCFSEVSGYSAFGSYTGNGSTDGPFVFTNHRPAFILIKSSTAAESWEIMDYQRATYNGATGELRANLSNAETTGNNVDFLSNGFKIRTTAGQWNTSGQTYIYACFAENPFSLSLAR